MGKGINILQIHHVIGIIIPNLFLYKLLMKQTEFFRNISLFSKEDLSDFDKSIKSPFFNTLQTAITVFGVIRKNILLASRNNFKDLKSVILKESGISEIHLRKILSKLNDLYIEYIKIKAFRSDKYGNEYMSSVYLLKTCNFSLLEKRVNMLESILSDSANTDHDLFIKLFDLNTLKYAVSASSENSINPFEKIEDQKGYMLESGKNLLVYFIARETINYLNYIIQCNGTAEREYPAPLEKYFSIINSPEFKSYNDIQRTTITLFHKIFKLFNNPVKDSNYKGCKSYFSKVKHVYNREFHKMMHKILLSFCNLRQKIKDIDRFYYLEAFNLSLEYIENQYYVSESVKYLDPVTYRNFVVTCFNLGKKALLAEFKDKHTDKLNPDDNYIMNRFCSAHLHYLNNNYELSVIDASIVSNLQVYFKFDLFILLIRSYYELNNFEEILKTLHNYLYYLNNGSYFNKFDKERYKYFHKFMNKFVTIYFKYEKTQNVDEFEYLLKQTESIKTFVMKNWLKEKLIIIISRHYSGIKRKRQINKPRRINLS